MSDFDAQQPVRAIATQFTTEVANASGTTINPAEDYAQGSTTSGQNGVLLQGAVTTGTPTYTTGTTNPLSLDVNGNLRVTVDATSSEQNVNLNQVGGSAISIGQATMSASLPVVLASNQSSIPVTLASTTITGTVAVTQSTSPWVVSGTVTSNIGTTNGLALDATVAKLTLAQGSTTSGETGALIMGAVTTAAPTYTTATTNPLSLDTAGNLRVTLAASAAEQNVNLNQVGGSAIALGQTTMSASLPVVLASNQSTISINEAQINGVALGSPSAYGTSPGAVTVPGVNAFVTNTVAENLTQVGGSALALGQTTMSASVPVVIASNQTPINVSFGGVTQTFTYVDNASVATNASVTQTVAGPINLDAVHVTASGEVKVVISTGVTGSETVKWVGFTSASNKNFDWNLEDTLVIPSGSDVKVTITNRDTAAMDIYSTVVNH